MTTRSKEQVILFAGPQDGLELTLSPTEPCPQEGYVRTERHDRRGRTVYLYDPKEST